MAKEEVNVSFHEKHIATLSGLIWDNTQKKWFGNKKTISAFQQNKEKALLLLHEEKKQNWEEITQEETPSLLSEEEWETFFTNLHSTIELVEAIHDFGMPNSRKQRIQIFNRLAEKKEGDYPVYYNDLIRYCKYFAARYPRKYVYDIINEYQITGKNLMKELNSAHMDEEQRMLLVFVFS